MKNKPIVAEVEELFIPELEKGETSSKPWSERDKKIIEKYGIEKRVKYKIIAKHLGRSVSSVRQVAAEIRLRREMK